MTSMLTGFQITLATLFLSMSGIVQGAEASATASRPNILLILADELG